MRRLVVRAIAIAGFAMLSCGSQRVAQNGDAATIGQAPAVDPTGKTGSPDAGRPEPAGKIREADAGADAREEAPVETVAEPPAAEARAREIRFEYTPSKRVADAYAMADEADRHRIVLTPGVEAGGEYPVVVAFHGQPKRGRDPREYFFPDLVRDLVVGMVRGGEIRPVVLVIPVFRFVGGNWPWMNPGKLRDHVEELLAEEGVSSGDWFAFGHSGAAGCGGAGLNQAHLMRPAGVGYFDTCLGDDWKKEVGLLEKAGVRTVNIHSVETAGFRPRQDPEYQSWFDFGRAYGPAGLAPVGCPKVHPGERLRDQKYRCAASKDGVITGFVVDSGEGVEAHKAILEPAIRYFLVHFAKLGTATSG